MTKKKRIWNCLEFFLPNRVKVFSFIRQVWMITSLLFAFYIWLFWFWTPLKSRFWPCSFRPTLKKISPIENFHFFVFYQSIYSALRKCKNWTCVFLIDIYLLPGGGCLILDSKILLRAHSNDYTKGEMYFFFVKVGAENVPLKLKFL